ncbi:serine/threonine-protein kinase [Paraliomyxa miuraensis]|uniref:serine/threonine-protein kinase n=1 Tax=Paraliomyxa miuraensis TaxID=376150 RepID=UPI00225000CB|nr:serine/threonine-protein kinase [Paraliomyxa miuraensis]MCX4241220.1 serine/threonine-protein kinase [Paraliomyxa miuraensis]
MDPDSTMVATSSAGEDTRPLSPRSRADAAPVRGTTLGRYLLLDRIGAGGMGVVHAAYDPELDRRVAIKLIEANEGRGATEGSRRLLREAQALAKLSHPNVVAIHDVGTHGELVWIAMEFVEGRTLGAWAREREPKWPELLRVLTDAARGVAAAHAAGLVHRDLKPDNVMIGVDGRVRVMDFGLAHGRGGSEASEAPDLEVTEDGYVDPPEPALSLQPNSALSLRLTRAGAIQGTPAYMAPEQWEGREAEAATDQFGWSVMAWELMHGERPYDGSTPVELAAAVLSGQRRAPPGRRRVPRWLRRIVERGLATRPSQRWPTMAILVAELERGRVRSRRRTMAVAGLGIAAAIAGFVVEQRWSEAQQIAACEAQGAVIDETWNATTREQLREALVATGVSYAEATAEKVTPWLDERAQEWKHARSEACLALEVRKTWGEDAFDRSQWCLEQERIELESLVNRLARADATAVQRAVQAVSSLGDADACLDEEWLLRQPMPPTEGREAARPIREALARSTSLDLDGDWDQAQVVAQQTRSEAEALGWPPLWAAARAQEADLLQRMGRYDEAESMMAEAYFEAARVGAWSEAAAAAISAITIVGALQARPAEGRRWAQHASVALEHAGDRRGLLEAQRLHALGAVLRVGGTYDDARELLERALAIRERELGQEHYLAAASLEQLAIVHEMMGAFDDALKLYQRVLTIRTKELGPDHPDVANTLGNLADVHREVGDHDEAESLYRRGLDITTRALGAEHPKVAKYLGNLGVTAKARGAHAEALTLFERALAIRERALGPMHPDLASTLNNVAVAHEAMGDHEKAGPLYERALAIWEHALGPDHPDVASALSNLANIRKAAGALDEAGALYERALAIKEKALGPEHPRVAVSLIQLATLMLERGDPARALTLFERAVVILDALPGVQNGEYQAHMFLAKALVATGGDLERALKEARFARDGFREGGKGFSRELAHIEEWLAAHQPTG